MTDSTSTEGPARCASGPPPDPFRLLAETVPALIAHVGTDERILHVNAAYAAWWSRAPEELVGERLEGVFGPETYAKFRSRLARVRKGERVEYERVLTTPDRVLWADVVLQPNLDADGELESFFVVAVDATERKLATRELQARVRQLELLQELSTGVARAKGLEEVYDRALEGLLEATEADRAALLLYDEHRVMRFVAWRGLSERYRRAVEGHSPWPPGAEDPPLVVVADVTAEPSLARALPALAEEGISAMAFLPLTHEARLLGKMVVYLDRPRSASHEELRLWTAIAEQVGLAIGRRLRLETLEELDQRKNHFLAVLGHELRNPLAAIDSGVRLLARRAADDAGLERLSRTMRRQSDQLVRLLADLLDVARIERGKIALRPESIDVGRVVDRASESVRPFLEEREIVLDRDVPTALWIEADPTRLEQILVNLLSNAAKCSPPGSAVSLVVEQSGDDVCFEVTDAGVGLTRPEMEEIFEPFRQLGGAAAEGSLGLGLTLVRQLAALHGGDVTVESEGRDQGATFRVLIPLRTSEPLDDTSSSRLSSPELGRLKILVVDDNVDAADGLSDLLRLESFSVRTAYCGEDVLSATEEFGPDVVLLDIGLPDVDGYEAARRLRASGHTGLLVAVTGYGHDEARRMVRDAGFDHHLLKPVAFEDLMDVLGRGC